MPDYGRDTDIGKPDAETINVVVETNADVVSSLAGVDSSLHEVMDKLDRNREALSVIYGQEIDTEEE